MMQTNSRQRQVTNKPPPGLSKTTSPNKNNSNNLNGMDNHKKITTVKKTMTINQMNPSSSFLRPNAPEFDVRSSPTIDPYGHPLGVSTRPEYVPPATTPPIVQPTTQSRSKKQYNPPRQYHQPFPAPYLLDDNMQIMNDNRHMSPPRGGRPIDVRQISPNIINRQQMNTNHHHGHTNYRSHHGQREISIQPREMPVNMNPNVTTPKLVNGSKTKTTTKSSHKPIQQPLSFHGGYKTASRNFGKPKENEIDPKFQNPSNLGHYQKWELLESAKRWLPGEGTVTTYNGYRYFLGAPIHMGMNGHIHYCYRYKIPTDDNKEQPEQVESVAAKVVPNTSAFAREIVILRALQGCENITKLYDVLESKRTLISILELAQADVYSFFVGRGAMRHGWSLEKPAVREAFARMVVTNVVQGLKQMHDNEYLHCDLKSLNILLYIYKTDRATKKGGVYMKAKLTDFGHSSHGKIRRSEATFRNGMARVGTAGHVAPELFKEGSPCDYKIDIWSLGIVMFSMLVPGRLLFGEYTNLQTLRKNYESLYKMNPYSKDRPKWWTDFERLSPEARDLILWMTQFRARDRPKGSDILAHPWFQISKGNLKPGEYRPNLRYVHRLSVSSIAQE